jgi:hypothetical protein
MLLQRQGWPVDKKLVRRLYMEIGLTVRSKYCRKIVSRGREVVPISAFAVNERWSMDFPDGSRRERNVLPDPGADGQPYARMPCPGACGVDG